MYDHDSERLWRHLDTCQYRTILHAEPPRCRCPEHGVRVVRLPWAEPHSHFTALFERLAIDWLKAASQQAVADQLGLTWDEVHGIMERAVRRGLTRRKTEMIGYLGVDEKSFRKGHKYVTLVNDLARGRVLYVAEDRKQSSLDGFWPTLTKEQTDWIAGVALDMWDPYVKSIRAHLPQAEEKMVFDKFHVAKHLGEAVDKVRRTEHKELHAEGDERLKGTKYDWLKGRDKFDLAAWRAVLPVATEQLEDIACVGAEGAGHEALGFHLCAGSAQALQLVVSLGHAQPPETNDRQGEDARDSLAKHPHLSEARHHQCHERKHQLENPMGQVHGPRFPQLRQLQKCHLLPLRRPRPVTSPHLNPGRAEKITEVFPIAFEDAPAENDILSTNLTCVAERALRQTMVGSGTRRLMVSTWVRSLQIP